MVATPAPAPETIPDEESIVAITAGLQLQAPPGDASAQVVVRPAHRGDVPVMATGNALTVSEADAKHPVANV